MAKTRMSVVIPSYQRPDDLSRCLRALALQTRPADEVIVMVRSGDRATQETISRCREELKTLRPILVSEPGVIFALNCGLDSARGGVLVLIDDDAEACPDWLERIEAAFCMDTRIGAVGGRDWLQLPDEPHLFDPPMQKRIGRLRWNGRLQGGHHCRLRGHAQRVMFLKGVNFAMRRSALGCYRIDEALRGSGAQWGWELDLCMHIRSKDLDVVFDDRILVKHYASPRPDFDKRQDATTVHPDIRFNRNYLIAKYFNNCQSLLHLGGDMLLGHRFAPGLLASVKWTLRGDVAVWRRLAEQAKHAFAGYSAGRRARAQRTLSADGYQNIEQRGRA
jgi:glycosyltransferase involved in cell wall biosynthesis